MGTVKDKLQEDAKKDGLIVVQIKEVMVPPAQQVEVGKKRVKQTAMQEVLIAKDYRELQPKFDEILSAVGDYFELFKNNTNKLEDLWLQLLDYLHLKSHSNYTLFKRTHYSTYIRKVIKFNVIQKVIEEAAKWQGTQSASEHLDAYLEKIREIEREAQFIPDTYEGFKKRSYLDTDLNAYTQKVVALEMEQLRKRKEQQAESQAKARALKK